MWLSTQLLALPSSLLLMIANTPTGTISQALEWPYNLPKHVKYYPEDALFVKREMDISRLLQQQRPHVIRKMSDDPGEKFFLHYWSFEEASNLDSWTNVSSLDPYDPPSALHSRLPQRNSISVPRHLGASLFGRTILDTRDFQCPSGYDSCASINRPNSCCADGSTCQLIQDTGLGDVGCCAAGQACAGQLSACAAGYTSCPSNPGGGCCIPGYACMGLGCVQTSTATVLVAPSPSSTPISVQTTTVTSTTVLPLPSTSSSTTSPSSTTTAIAPVAPATTTSTSPSASTTTVTTVTSITSTAPNVLACSTGYRSCPASLGGGCCPTDRGCGSGVCPELSSTNSVAAPVRPTTGDTTTTSFTTTPVSVCPTGFYACSAYYQGGCCQTGRDCQTSSCPSSASTSLITTNGVTVIAPTGNGISTQNLLTGTCASGWVTCASSDGGGCCPSGYACGMACTATASGGGANTVGKDAPSSAQSINLDWFGKGFVMASVIALSSMLLL